MKRKRELAEMSLFCQYPLYFKKLLSTLIIIRITL